MKKIFTGLGIVLSVFIILVFSFLTILNFLPSSTQEKVSALAEARRFKSLEPVKALQIPVVKTVILGDSIAVSDGASHPSLTGWDSNLKFTLKEYDVCDMNIDNKGLTGTLVSYCLERAQEISSDTNAVFICVGRNDRNQSFQKFSDDYNLLIQVIKEKAPKAKIYCIVQPPTISADGDRKFTVIRNIIGGIAYNNHVFLIDTWGSFPSDQTELGRLFMDGLHPNDIGYELMKDIIYNSIFKTIIDSDLKNNSSNLVA